jgi:hypothetical protein
VKPNTSWKVAQHGPLEQLGENLWSVTAKLKMPLGETTRHMTVAKLKNGGLVIYSAIALAEPEMAKLEALGRPKYLVVPSGIHRMDARPWKERYPDLVVIAPAGARDKVGEVVGVDCTLVNFGDPAVRLFAVPGTANRELAMVVGKTLVVNDLIFNLPRLRGVRQWIYRLLGFGPGKPTIPKLVAKKLVDDEAAMKAELRRWANTGFERVLVAHGAPIENPREALLALAA